MTDTTAQGRPKVWRAILAMLFPPISMVLLFGAFGAYFAIRHGLRGEEIGKAMEPIAAIPVLLNFALIFGVTLLLMRKDGRTLRDIGWALERTRIPVEVGIGIAGGALFAALNHFAFFPLIRSLPQLGPAPFDPTLPQLSLGVLLLVQLVGAVVEDTLYRGYGLTQLRWRWGALAAVLGTSVAHALFAFGSGPIVMAWHLPVAAFLAALALWRRTIWVAFVAHLVLALTPRLLSLL